MCVSLIVSSSRCHGLVCDLGLCHFLVIYATFPMAWNVTYMYSIEDICLVLKGMLEGSSIDKILTVFTL